MRKKLRRVYLPTLLLLTGVLAVFTALSFRYARPLAVGECAAALCILVYVVFTQTRREKEMAALLEKTADNANSGSVSLLRSAHLPMAAFRLEDGEITWGSRSFWRLCGRDEVEPGSRLQDLLPELSVKWLGDGRESAPELLELDGKKYKVWGHRARQEKGQVPGGVLYLEDVTEAEATALEYRSSRPVEMVVIVDNYEDLLKPLTDRQRIEVRGRLDAVMEKWSEGKNGLMRRFDRDRYLFIIERRYLDEIVENRFSLLDDIRAVEGGGGIPATASIGVGLDGSGYEENFLFASMAAEMALTRGGDQAVIKNKVNYEFYGGRGDEAASSNKVRTRTVAEALSRLIQESSNVYIMGHKLADLDTVGAAVGLCAICRKLGKPARIVVNEPHASQRLFDMLDTLPEYAGVRMLPQEALLEADRASLLIVADTNRPEQADALSLLQSISRVVIVDHHVRAATYIDNAVISYYEPGASSACELTAELMEELLSHGDVLPEEADAVLSGIVMDTKNFTLRTGERTFAAAAWLRRCGGDTSRVKLLLQNGMEETIARYEILRCARLYKGIAVAAPEGVHDRVVSSQAADELLNIHDVTASVVLYPMENGGVGFSARSIGAVNVQVLLEELGGGGNKSSAGAQLADVPPEEGLRRLLAAIDHYMETE